MNNIYNKPFRVYLIFIVLAIIGITAGLNLPISLFPNTTKPTISIGINYNNISAKEFIKLYGMTLESTLKNYEGKGVKVISLKSQYLPKAVDYQVDFRWKDDAKVAKFEIEQIVSSLSSNWPKKMRQSVSISFWNRGSGFFAISVYSDKRTLNETYNLLEPIIDGFKGQINDASYVGLWNPEQQEISIELNLSKINSLRISPQRIIKIIQLNLKSSRAGLISTNSQNYNIDVPSKIKNLQTLKRTLIPVRSGSLFLEDVATITLKKTSGNNKIYKTDGIKSLILFANPRMGGNIKNMSEELKHHFNNALKKLPKDIKFKILVDPSRFINNSVNNVLHEILIAACLAVFIMFLFIGSLKNTITAAIEIPLSMILAFIVMKATGMNLNLISLSGLSLAAGMNVDASVVVLENIFRYFKLAEDKKLKISKKELIFQAVNEVKRPIITSTLSTIVVFAPLAFTHGLTNGVLGDLAKAVVFSHSFSLFIALVLVPTIRTQLSSNSITNSSSPVKSPIEGGLLKLENLYTRMLRAFIKSNLIKAITTLSFIGIFYLSAFVFFPKIKKEIIGTPNSDWIYISITANDFKMISEMDDLEAKLKNKLLLKFPNKFLYTFERIRTNRSSIMVRVKKKNESEKLTEEIKELFTNTPKVRFWVGQWNPSTMPLPNEKDVIVTIKDGNLEDRQTIASFLRQEIKSKDLFKWTYSEVSEKRKYQLNLKPKVDIISNLEHMGYNFNITDIYNFTQIISDGYRVDSLTMNNKNYNIKMSFDKKTLNAIEKLKSFPIFINDLMLPLSALVKISFEKAPPSIFHLDSTELNVIYGQVKKGDQKNIPTKIIATQKIVDRFKEKSLPKLSLISKPIIEVKDGRIELNSALKNLGYSLLASVLLILITLLIQFESFAHSFIVMIAIPFGIIGGVSSLYFFNSTISLNSILGIILLNGVAVNNSIILADFIKKMHNQGFSAIDAATIASTKRLRPILITSLTTILGMLPIALGFGDGGKIIQPLGIVVSSGLWFSMLFTLFIVPALEERYLRNKIISKELITTNPLIDEKITNNQLERKSIPTWQ